MTYFQQQWPCPTPHDASYATGYHMLSYNNSFNIFMGQQKNVSQVSELLQVSLRTCASFICSAAVDPRLIDLGGTGP